MSWVLCLPQPWTRASWMMETLHGPTSWYAHPPFLRALASDQQNVADVVGGGAMISIQETVRLYGWCPSCWPSVLPSHALRSQRLCREMPPGEARHGKELREASVQQPMR